jgi:pimeloyl-ACP methyl ester carboxylesterase
LKDYTDSLGFPDSFVLWRHFLQSSSLQNDNILIAVDLPGYGGSDSLPAYDPNEVLGTLTEFVIGVREQFTRLGCGHSCQTRS